LGILAIFLVGLSSNLYILLGGYIVGIVQRGLLIIASG